MIPAAHRAHYLSVTAGLLMNELHGSGIRSEAHARVVALAEQMNEIAGTLRNELAGQPDARDCAPPDEPVAAGGNVVPLPMRTIRRG